MPTGTHGTHRGQVVGFELADMFKGELHLHAVRTKLPDLVLCFRFLGFLGWFEVLGWTVESLEMRGKSLTCASCEDFDLVLSRCLEPQQGAQGGLRPQRQHCPVQRLITAALQERYCLAWLSVPYPWHNLIDNMESSEHSGTMVCPGWGVGHCGTLGQPPAVSICQSWELNLNIFPSYSHHPHYQNHNFHFLGRERPLKHICCNGQPKMAPYKEDSSALKEVWLDKPVAVLRKTLISSHLNILVSSFPRQNSRKIQEVPEAWWPVMWPGQFSVTPWSSLSSRQLLPRSSLLLQLYRIVRQFRGTSDRGGGADIYSSGPGPRSNCPPWHRATLTIKHSF